MAGAGHFVDLSRSGCERQQWTIKSHLLRAAASKFFDQTNGSFRICTGRSFFNDSLNLNCDAGGSKILRTTVRRFHSIFRYQPMQSFDSCLLFTSLFKTLCYGLVSLHHLQ